MIDHITCFSIPRVHMPSPQTLLPRLLGSSPPPGEEIGQLTPAGWSAVLDLARALWLEPLLYRQVVQAFPDALIPPETAARLRAAYYQTQASNAYLLRELAAVLAAFQQAGIPAVVLKGAALAHFTYRDPGLRPMADLDLLLSEPDLARAAALLQPLGFTPMNRYWSDLDLSDAKHLPPFIKDDRHILELHWSLTRPAGPLRLDQDALRSRCQPVVLDGIPALALGPEDELLYLGIHASYNHKFYQQLRSLCDIHELVTFHAGGLDWDAFAERALAWNAARGLYLALRLARGLLGSPLPEAVLERLRPPDDSPAVQAWATARLFETNPVLSENFVKLLSPAPGQGRLAAFVKAMLPPPALMSQLYQIQPGSWKVYLKYPAHWLDRVTRYGKNSVRLLGHEQELSAQAEAQLNLLDWLNR